jgi:hypothetical protein
LAGGSLSVLVQAKKIISLGAIDRHDQALTNRLARALDYCPTRRNPPNLLREFSSPLA